MKDIYPPRLNLHYTLIASDGTTIRESDGKLLDMSYLQRAVPTRDRSAALRQAPDRRLAESRVQDAPNASLGMVPFWRGASRIV